MLGSPAVAGLHVGLVHRLLFHAVALGLHGLLIARLGAILHRLLLGLLVRLLIPLLILGSGLLISGLLLRILLLRILLILGSLLRRFLMVCRSRRRALLGIIILRGIILPAAVEKSVVGAEKVLYAPRDIPKCHGFLLKDACT